MKKIFLIGTLACLGTLTIAQDGDDKNLVQNPSFEALAGKLKKTKQIDKAAEWDSPTALKADLFSTTTEGLPCGAPVNDYGKESPYDGSNYAGIVMYSYNNKEPRTYLQSKLIAPLRKDVTYCVKFYVSLSDLSKYAVNNFGMYFSKDGLTLEEKGDIIIDKEKERESIALNTDNRVYNERYNWIPVCGTYTASGKENFITIGNFYNNKETQYEKLKKLENFNGTQIPTAYYYIDQIEVFIMEDPAECACNQAQNDVTESVVYNKNTASEDGFSIDEQVKLATVYFDVKKSKLEPNMVGDLDILAGSMKANPEYKLKIHSHLDADEGAIVRKDPEDPICKDLDVNRAKVVKDYLISKGVEESRIAVETHKDKEQVAFGTTTLDHAKNRRVEFELVK
ncbi:MAG: OmpA family protein [Flavobacteriales bacterium]|nr:OmpA family protein [Flavobacteriales bacterium]